MSEKNYLASDISTILNVPRTTVNDWLKSYAGYLDTEPRGKRRAYTEKSLEVLRQILKWREAGLAPIDIEQELAKEYGIRPEIATEEPVSEDTSLLAVGEGGSGLARLTEDDLGKLLGMLDAQQEQRQQGLRRFGRFAFISIFLLFAIVAVMLAILTIKIVSQMQADAKSTAYNIHHLAEHVDNAVANLDIKQASAISSIVAKSAADTAKLKEEQSAELNKIAISLEGNNREYKAAIEQLKSELDEQRKARDEEMKRLIAEKDKATEAEMIRLKEEFARKQLEELQRLEGVKNEKKLLEAKIENYEKAAPEEARRLQESFEAKYKALQEKIAEEKRLREKAEIAAETAQKQTLELMAKDAEATLNTQEQKTEEVAE